MELKDFLEGLAAYAVKLDNDKAFIVVSYNEGSESFEMVSNLCCSHHALGMLRNISHSDGVEIREVNEKIQTH